MENNMKLSAINMHLLALISAVLVLSGTIHAGSPHLMPKITPGARHISAPSGAKLLYYGGRVVSNMEVVQVLWGTGSYIPEVSGTGTPSIASFYQGVLNSSYIDWLTEYNTTITAQNGSAGTQQTIGHGAFVGQVTI